MSNEQDQADLFQYNLAREVLEVVAYGLPLFLFFSYYVLQNYKVPTESMENTILIGDHITVSKFYLFQDNFWDNLVPAQRPKRGDVIAFQFPLDTKLLFIKRLIGLPGDRVTIEDDQVFINSKPLEEPYAYYKTHDASRDPDNSYFPMDFARAQPGLSHAMERPQENIDTADLIDKTKRELTIYYMNKDPQTYRRLVNRLESGKEGAIPPGFFLAMGDNRNNSFDGRSWGLVPMELLKGKAYWVWWSYGEDQGSHEQKSWHKWVVYLRYPLTFWTRTHWDKCFKRIQ